MPNFLSQSSPTNLPLREERFQGIIFIHQVHGKGQKLDANLRTAPKISATMHFIGRVTMLFANNSLMECLITMKFLHIFLHPDVIFISHTMFINASTKEFTLVNNAIWSYDNAFEELLYCRLAPPILWSWHIANNHIEISHRYNIRYQFKSNGHSSLICCEL